MRHLLILCSLFIFIGCKTITPPKAGIYQFTEVRNDKKSVWGIDIQLDRLSFKSKIDPSKIKIIEGKHNHDLKEIMKWNVSSNKKCLHIRFKQNTGDFGSGNSVTVHINKSAIVGYPGGNNRFEWSILTDIQ